MRALTLIFIVSGAAGLIYESIWSRYLGLFVGHSAYAQVIVLVIFLGGMSLGAFVAGERSSRLARPLRWYAYVELVAGVIGLVFHFVFVQVTALAHDRLFPAAAATGAVPALQWILAGLLILPQSVLLGSTFPLMSTAAVRAFPNVPGRNLSLLYFGNSLGAAAGVLAAGFVLLRLGGLPGTLATAAAMNIVAFAAALAMDRRLARSVRADPAAARPATRPRKSDRAQKRRRRRSQRSDERAPASTARQSNVARKRAPAWFGVRNDTSDGRPLPLALVAPSEDSLARLTRPLLAIAFGTALASFIYEIAWIRMLSLVLGSTTHAFELMLSAFILGLALGALFIRNRLDALKHPVLALGVIQWAMGLLALATLPLYASSFNWFTVLQEGFRGSAYGYELYVISRYALCLIIMLPATFFAGMTLPLITRTLLAAGAGERAIGRVYAINTLGSIIGVIIAALVLMPVIGLKFLLALGALADMALGAFILVPVLRRRLMTPERRALAFAGTSLLFVAATLWLTELDRAVLTSGVFRYGQAGVRQVSEVLFYRDGRTATVSVRYTRADDKLTLTTNGKPDASLDRTVVHPRAASRFSLAGDNATQILLPIVALAHAPTARTAAVIGQGSGVSSHFLLGGPNLQRVVTIEIEPEMIPASRLFYPFNRRVFDDSRSELVIDDAKAFFSTQQRSFDLILSEPSNPWVSGVSGLFTAEFYRHVRRYMAPGAVFGQWLHLYEMTDEMVLSVIAALDQAFGDYEIFMVAPGDIIIVATREPRLRPPDWEVIQSPAIREDLARARIPGAPVFERLRLAGRSVISPMLGEVQANSDYHPVLDLNAERARYTRTRAEAFASLAQRWFHIPDVLAQRKLDFFDDPESPTLGMPRLAGVVLGARLRAARTAGFDSALSGPPGSGFFAAVQRLKWLYALADAGQPPAAWRGWMETFAAAERDLHFGTLGVADHGFYSRMLEYARTHGADPDLVAAVEYLYAVSAWNFDEVLRLAPIVEGAQRRGRPFISSNTLRDGAVVAYILRGDAASARERMNAMSPYGDSTNAEYNFRTRMLWGAIQTLERRGS